ncbi:Virulence-associated protein E [Hymenobacter daecheongensis DSM 21074]|uniref:Virulence-associated protein E n=1 Tax=Hymenobacter daecheongensis DSM 21074 TaxID=1121955 RepID=A0A1M6EYE5_9BACT|nr:VapE domain-containing protein [Hymenobacter daecheongensis]SHI90487.1 Virulence-associated protein E [Hymenobacter daecheongensis DSM 21074]
MKRTTNSTAATPSLVADGDQKLRAVETYISTNNELYYNVVKEVVEWRPAGSAAPYQLLDDYRLNSLSRELTHHGCPMRPDGLYRLLASDFTPRVDPLQQYFIGLGESPADGTIAQLAATVTVADPATFALYLKKWVVSVVANALTSTGCQNHTCLVLTGGQGRGKTTWLELLCPKPLAQQYLFTGKIHVESKDTQLLLSEYLFINIDDQLRTLNKQDENSLKTLITQPSVKVRRPYARLITELPRRASFMGSVNGADFLTDPTGSRRFLPFEVEAIDLEAAQQVDITAVWREAYQLWKGGFQYWFADDEMLTVHERNRQFQHDTPEYDLVAATFVAGNNFLTLAQIKERLQVGLTTRNLRDKAVGEALARLGIKRQQRRIEGDHRVAGYLVRELVHAAWEDKTSRPIP